MFYFDPAYLIYAIPPLLFGMWAQWRVSSTFKRYARVPTSSGINGAQTAELLMERTGHRFGVVQIPGMLTDYYDPSRKAMCLSQSSAQNSVASVAVVAHEFGHAIQDVEGYAPMKMRSAIVPAVKVGSWVGPLLFMAGLILSVTQLAWAGIILFSATAVFAIVTLPVELNASSRALQMLQTNGVLSAQEMPGAQAVLSAAALTYLAAIAQSVMQLLYYVSLMGRRR
ncbi:MAG TPA: zinc metallopeptidase [Candidatus Eremiobacteraceae bacterium]|nr:zinc metallopeptidase [Candidatus Eremiobacteraceae bacterium]